MDDMVDCVVVCCAGACEACADSPSGASTCCCCGCVVASLATLALVAVLVAAFAVVSPVRVTVDEASLGRLALAAPSRNVTAALAYDLSLADVVRNTNWATAVWRTAPLDAELRFRGRPFARARLAGADRGRIRARRKEVYRVTVPAESAPVALGPDGAAEFARESAARVFELELAVAGEVKYEARFRRRSLRVSCPLKLSPSMATAAAAFTRVKCMHA
ncbi:hypothetical protein ACP70R_006039 [Stipagrostis hirtigluma subsp. patula]